VLEDFFGIEVHAPEASHASSPLYAASRRLREQRPARPCRRAAVPIRFSGFVHQPPFLRAQPDAQRLLPGFIWR
jgi:hypothetical protein